MSNDKITETPTDPVTRTTPVWLARQIYGAYVVPPELLEVSPEDRISHREVLMRDVFAGAKLEGAYARTVKFSREFLKAIDGALRSKYNRYLRGRYLHRHKGKSLRRHGFNAMFDTIRPLTLEQAEERMVTIRQELHHPQPSQVKVMKLPVPETPPGFPKVKYIHLGNGPVEMAMGGHHIKFDNATIFAKEPA